MSVLALLVAIAAAWTLWRAYHRRRTLFANLPGPPSSGNWLAGKESWIPFDASLFMIIGSGAGHLPVLFDRNGWEFQREVTSAYGQVVRIDGALGVRFQLAQLVESP